MMIEKPVYSFTQIADCEINGYWQWSGELPHHFASHTITYSLSGLTGNGNASLAQAEKSLATEALNAWHEVANVSFVAGSASADIVFSDAGRGVSAATVPSYGVAGSYTGAVIDITTGWIARYGANPDSYSYQSYLHEIGHALGLGHTGPYNGSATYSSALYANDTWQYSVMSYFSQSNYDSGSTRYVLTPEIADIVAVQSLYPGAVATTRPDATTYGFHSNAGALYDFSDYPLHYSGAGGGAPALTIYDSGGEDSLDCSQYGAAQVIDLRPGNYSSIGGLAHNIGLAEAVSVNGVVIDYIENAVGGMQSDHISGNPAVNDLRGNAGDDVLEGGRGNDTLDGGSGNDALDGGSGNDVLTCGPGNDTAVGGLGFDIAAFAGTRDAYTIMRSNGTVIVSAQRGRPLP